MQQQQDSESGGDVVFGPNDRGQHAGDECGVGDRKYVGSRGIDTSGVNTCVTSRRQGHVDVLERLYRW